MNTIFASENEMDFSHLDDKMEIGTSPYPQIDDIDFEFNVDRQQSVDRSMVDDAEGVGNVTDLMQADPEAMYNDDDMLDDETMQQTFDHDLVDFNMESYDTENLHDRDEEILYEDEDIGSYDMAGEGDHQQQTQQGATQLDQDVTQSITETATEEQVGDHHVSDDHSNTNNLIDINETHLHPGEENATEIEKQETNSEPKVEVTSSVEVVDFAVETTNDHEQEELTTNDNNSHPESQEAVVSGVLESQNTKAEANQGRSPSNERSLNTQDSTKGVEAVAENVTVNVVEAESNNLSNPTEQPHPVTVLYLGQEMSLFPPMIEDSSATFFLSDASLVNESVEKLLFSCREVLGETLVHDDELVLDVPTLGLHLCEDSKFVSQVTLSQIIDVYINLCQNEGIEHIEPLYCSLTSRVCLASQYSYLVTSVIEGTVYSEIAAQQADSPDDESVPFHEDVEETEISVTDEIADVDSAQRIDDKSATDVQVTQHDVHTQSNEDTQPDVDAAAHTNLPDEFKKNSAEDTTSLQGNEHTNDETIPQVDASRNLDEKQQLVETSQAEPEEEEDAVSQLADNNELDYRIEENENIFEDEEAEHDIASVSSHTVEGEVVIESIQRSQTVSQHVDDSSKTGNQPNGYSIIEDADDYNLDEGLFNEDDLEHDQTQDDDHESFAPSHKERISAKVANVHPTVQIQANTDEKDELALDNTDDESADELELLGAEDNTDDGPITPGKQNDNKRKALDEEDDLDFLDFSTPEPKRTRPS